MAFQPWRHAQACSLQVSTQWRLFCWLWSWLPSFTALPWEVMMNWPFWRLANLHQPLPCFKGWVPYARQLRRLGWRPKDQMHCMGLWNWFPRTCVSGLDLYWFSCDWPWTCSMERYGTVAFQVDVEFLVQTIDEFNVYDRRMLANVLTTVAPYFDNDQRMRLLNQMRISSVSLSTYTSERDSRNRISSSTARSDRTNSDDKGGDMFNSSIADHSRNANVEEEPEKGVEEVRLSVPVQDPEEREERSAPSFEAHNRVHFAETFRTMEIWNQSSTLDWREAMWIAGERTNPPTVACDHAQLCTDFLLEFFVAGSAWSIFCLQDPANAPGKCQLAVYQGHQEPPQEILQQVSFFIRGCLLLRCICWANLREVAVLDMIDAVWMLGTHQSLTSWN